MSPEATFDAIRRHLDGEDLFAVLRAIREERWRLREGHGYRRKENRDVYQQAVMMFLDRYLHAP